MCACLCASCAPRVSIRIKSKWKFGVAGGAAAAADGKEKKTKQRDSSNKRGLFRQARSYCKLEQHYGGEPSVTSHQGVQDS